MKKTGFIGIGIMGKPMAFNLLNAGVSLEVFDVNQEAVKEVTAAGAEYVLPKDMGKSCDVIFTILPSGEIVEEVLFGDQGLCSGIKEGCLIIDMSSVTPAQSKHCAKKLGELGCGFIDSPVSGGETGAVNATLAFMAGGRKADFEKARPYFDMMGSSALLIGPNGSGSVAKLSNQIIVNLNIAAVSEALVLASKAGADPWLVYEAIRGGLAGSAVLDAKAPMMIERNFKPGGKISINHKDIKNVMAAAHEADVPLPFTAQLYEVMQALKVGGHMGDDHSGIVQYFEQLAGIEVRRPEVGRQ